MAPFLKKICRICEQNSENQLKNVTEMENQSLITKYLICANVIVSRMLSELHVPLQTSCFFPFIHSILQFSIDDRLPKYFCTGCIVNLNVAYEFRVQCELTQEKFFGSLLATSSESDEQNVNHSSIILPQTNGNNSIKEEDTWDIQYVDKPAVDGENFVEPLDLLVSTYDFHVPIKSPQRDNTDDTKSTRRKGVVDNNKMEPVVKLKPLENDVKAFHSDNEDECESKLPKVAGKRTSQRNRTPIFTNEPFKCGKCVMAFECKRDLKRHQQSTHISRKTYQCVRCKAEFNKKSTLVRHQQTTHFCNKPFKCKKCKAKFSRKVTLVAHQKIHSNRNAIECNQCKARFYQNHSLMVHQRIHTGERPFQCNQCNAAFAQSTDLMRHQRTHTGEKPFKCDKCTAAFVKNYDLVRHRKTHTGEKPYRCEQCNEKYRRKEHLVSHLRQHSGETPFKCNHCKAAFLHKPSLIRHQHAMHIVEKPSKCKAAAFDHSHSHRTHTSVTDS